MHLRNFHLPVRTLTGLLLLGLALAACAPLGVKPGGENRLAPSGDGAVEYHILAAEMAGQRGHLDVATEHYLQALSIRPDAQLAERATRVALYAEQYDAALRMVLIWLREAPERHEARLLLARLALSVSEPELALASARDFLASHPDGRAQGYRDLVGALKTGEGQMVDGATGLMRGLASEFATEAEAHYVLGLVLLGSGDVEAASEAADTALDLRPDWREALLLKLTTLLKQQRVIEAEALVGVQTSKNAAEAASLHIAYARLLLEADYSAEALFQFETALALKKDHPEALYALGLLQLNERDFDAAYGYLRRLYDVKPKNQAEVAYYLGGIEEERKNYQAALRWYQKIDGKSYAAEAQLRSIYVLWQLGRKDAAREQLARMRDEGGEQRLRAYLIEGELLFEDDEYEAAEALYEQALGLYPDEPDLLYSQSLIAERLGDIEAAERGLRRLLALDPEDARSMNALGYILSNHTNRFEEALALIQKALEKTPEDAAVIDSMGWIQYRLGALETALEFLQRAFEKMPDPEVAAHLGEVLWQLGHQQQAQEVWNEALRDNPDHPVLQETIQRLMR